MKKQRKTIPECEGERGVLSDEQKELFVQNLHLLDSVSTECLCVLDVPQKQFVYVKLDPLFLCDFSVEDALRDGYDFYAKIVYSEDLSLWTDMYKAVIRYLKDFEAKRDEIDSFSCTLRLQYNLSIILRPIPQMICHRMKPVWVDNKLRYLLCSVRTSNFREAGHLCVYGKDGQTYKEYQFVTKRWKQKTKILLTECEYVILRLSKQDISCKEIANMLCKSQHTIGNQIQTLYSKLGVHSMPEAIEYVYYYRLLHPSRDIVSLSAHEKNDELFTEELLRRLQQHLADKKGVRQAARMENVPESTVRNWIKEDKLTRTK
ncbi:MAG: LuxR C-terminal-related transcriptional regulator [Tannerella sp.]|jgi:DNA-binding CsgD family transcriptional regulator|nr:LuxR C-terminal-related transcriptional regulator [Tannerella sp.]